jgi:AcrR family transcriptional regulator
MGRWAPDSRGRLQEAAMKLFIERGYENVTVADIAERAGLTKRSFFNHFADKREVFFAQADVLEARVVAALAEADGAHPLDAAVAAYAEAGAEMEGFADLVRARREIVDSSSELRERELAKMASLTTSVAAALAARGVEARDAFFAAQAATTIYMTATDDWARDPQHGIAAALQDALVALRASLAKA